MVDVDPTNGMDGRSESWREPARPSRVRTALFVDFDNIYSGLLQQDTAAAEEFAMHPRGWVDWLQDPSSVMADLLGDDLAARSVLLRRCYLNPGVYHMYRAYFVNAGFQVVDCPSITQRGKNGADIQMVMDILEALQHPTHFDEFIVMSGDSDFTPVLIRLRAHDRRTMILTVGFSAAAYRAASDVVLTEDVFIDYLRRPHVGTLTPTAQRGIEGTVEAARIAGSSNNEGGVTRLSGVALREEAARIIRQLVDSSPRPIASGQVALSLTNAIGSWLRETDWDGTHGFREFVTTLPDIEGLVRWDPNPGYFYDPVRHRLPEAASPRGGLNLGDARLNALATRVHDLTDTPALHSATYASIFNEIAAELRENPYNLNDTSRAVRDRCKARGLSVSRKDTSFILIGLGHSEYGFTGHDHDPNRLGATFLENVVRLAQRVQLDLTDDDRALLDAWILGGLRNDHAGNDTSGGA